MLLSYGDPGACPDIRSPRSASNAHARRVYLIAMSRRAGIWMMLSLAAFVILSIFAWVLVTQPLFPSQGTTRAVVIDPARLEAHVRVMCETFVPRDESHPNMLDRAADYIRKEFDRAGGRVTYQSYDLNGTTYRNVIAQFGQQTIKRIVVGAHYDSVAPYVPAADDNASGVAALIELAYAFGDKPPPMQVELVAYTLEEGQHFRTQRMGSAVHARSLQNDGVPVRAMFSLEMLGYFTDAPNSQRYPHPIMELFYPSRGNFIAVVGKLDQPLLVRRVKAAMRQASRLPVHSINAPRAVPGIDFSDHRNYWAAGYDAVMITDTAFYRNPHYHTARDTPDTLDYHRMAMVTQGVFASVMALAH